MNYDSACISLNKEYKSTWRGYEKYYYSNVKYLRKHTLVFLYVLVGKSFETTSFFLTCQPTPLNVFLAKFSVYKIYARNFFCERNTASNSFWCLYQSASKRNKIVQLDDAKELFNFPSPTCKQMFTIPHPKKHKKNLCTNSDNSIKCRLKRQGVIRRNAGRPFLFDGVCLQLYRPGRHLNPKSNWLGSCTQVEWG